MFGNVLEKHFAFIYVSVKDFKKQKTGNENDDAGPKFSFNPAKAFRGSDALIPLEVCCVVIVYAS